MTYPVVLNQFGLYTGEPTDTEILQRLAFHLMHGPNHLAIKHTCPACSGKHTEWVRNQWAICYDCEIAFDAFEWYEEPTPDGTQEVECIQMDCNLCLTLKGMEERTYGVARSIVQPARFAVKEDGVLLLVCAKCMEEFYGMHETVLLLADTRVPFDDEPDEGEDGGE